MRSVLLRLATTLVRAWTRLYTHGLPRTEQAARRAEIESDLWEFEHDPEAPQGSWAAIQVLARLLIGIPDDLAWRMDVGATAHHASVSALAAAGMITGPRRVSAFGLSATIHIVAISAVIWLASGGPAASTNPSEAAPGLADVERGFAPDLSVSNQPVTHELKNQSVMTMPARAFAAVSAVAVAVAARVRLITRPRLAAQAPPSTSGPFPQTTQWSASADRFIARILQNRYSLSVRNGQLSGTGADMLRSAIAQSRFVLLGEEHGFAQAPELATAICNAAGSDRFHAMAIEEGPLAAAALESFARRRDGLAQLSAFAKSFPQSINVYNSRGEFEMLQQCARAAQGEFHLWGLNQEALGAAGLILSRILETGLGASARPAMRQLLQKNDDAYRKALQSGSLADLFMLSADNQDLARGAAVLHRDGSPEAQSLFASLIESHQINRVSPADYDNARRRERVMTTRFEAEYTQAAKASARPPRVLLKFGAYHIYRGLNPVQGRGIGNFVAEFADQQGAQSLHIRLMAVKRSQPIYPNVGQPAHLRPFNLEDDPRSQYLQPMLSNRLQSEWTLFDLRPLRRDFDTLVGSTNPALATLVFGIDMLVMVPEGTPSTGINAEK
jgi:hypothetical protein